MSSTATAATDGHLAPGQFDSDHVIPGADPRLYNEDLAPVFVDSPKAITVFVSIFGAGHRRRGRGGDLLRVDEASAPQLSTGSTHRSVSLESQRVRQS